MMLVHRDDDIGDWKWNKRNCNIVVPMWLVRTCLSNGRINSFIKVALQMLDKESKPRLNNVMVISWYMHHPQKQSS